ncbi:MAG: DUF4249 domain-containing protein [Bacteroidales bacterium]|nr:DUF4249 domain-containing protein [Bacteroidales bacterium]
MAVCTNVLDCMSVLKTFFLLLMASFFLCSCQKEVELDLPSYDKKLVIEGTIVNGEHPYVIISRSIAYLSNINVDTLVNNILVSDAVVTVTSSKGESEVLKYQLCSESPIGFAYVGNTMVGECGTDYQLDIQWRGNSYSAKTSILQPFKLDSAWLAPMTSFGDSAATIRIQLTDDPSQTNYYQFCVKVHGKKLTDKLWVSTIPVVFDDGVFSGQTVNYDISRGNPSTIFTPTLTDEERAEYTRMTFRPGDTVFLRYSAIDYTAYRFWSSASSDIMFGQNPFLNPTPIESNIKGDNVLGVWCGYASQVQTLIF